MLCLTCSGTPDEVGYEHGTAARALIQRSISFYAVFFQKQCKMSWASAQQFAAQYIPYLSSACPELLAEMQGVARGADVPLLSILALNVRTEIAFGAFSDGCTALAWTNSPIRPSSHGDGGSSTNGNGYTNGFGHTTHSSNGTNGHSASDPAIKTILAQNWDWDIAQGENLICLNVKVLDTPWISMITEAGIIGKIGLSSNGVGCTLNAIRARGAYSDKLPCHVALRVALGCDSMESAAATLEECGVASACHILVADAGGAVGLECSAEDVVRLEMNEMGTLTHTNHYIRPHATSVKEGPDWMPDSRFRLDRINELLANAAGSPSMEAVEAMLRDEAVEEEAIAKGTAAAICRSTKETSNVCTLFSIAMELSSATARVVVGKPTTPKETIELRPREM